MNRVTGLLFAVLILVCLFAVAPLSAQEVTPEPTPEDTVTVPVEVVTNAQTTNSLITIVAGVILAILGGGSFALVIHRLDKRTKDEAEQLYLALPPQWQTTVLRILDAAEATLELAREVTDGQPNAETTTSTPPVSDYSGLNTPLRTPPK